MKVKKRELKKELKRLYDAPPPQEKSEFLKQFKIPAISMGEFMWQQLWYMKKITWFLSLGIFAIAIFLGRFLHKEAVWVLSATVPYLALTILTESGKSKAYNMEELEYVTRFSLKSVLLARMGAVACLHGMIFLVLTICMGTHFYPGMEDLFYLLVPYLFTVCIGIRLLRIYRGRESAYVCVGVPVFVSIFVVLIHQTLPFVYGLEMQKWWVLSFPVLIFYTIKEWFLFLGQREDIAWN